MLKSPWLNGVADGRPLSPSAKGRWALPSTPNRRADSKAESVHERLSKSHTLVSSRVIDYLDQNAEGGARGHGDNGLQMSSYRGWEEVLEVPFSRLSPFAACSFNGCG